MCIRDRSWVVHRSVRRLMRHARKRRAVARGRKAGEGITKKLEEKLLKDSVGGYLSVGDACAHSLHRSASAMTGMVAGWDTRGGQEVSKKKPGKRQASTKSVSEKKGGKASEPSDGMKDMAGAKPSMDSLKQDVNERSTNRLSCEDSVVSSSMTSVSDASTLMERSQVVEHSQSVGPARITEESVDASESTAATRWSGGGHAAADDALHV